MRILFITRHNPFLIGGGSFATKAYLCALNEIFSGQIDVILGDSSKIKPLNSNNKYIQVPERTFFQKFFGLLIYGRIHRFNPFVKRYLKDNYRDYSICVFDGSIVAGDIIEYVKFKKIKTVTFHHNVERDYFQTANKKDIYSKLEYYYIKRNESVAYKKSDINLFISSADMKKMNELYGILQSNYVVGCFESEKRSITKMFPKTIDSECVVLVLSGSLLSEQTHDAIMYFIKELLPTIQQKCQVIITGREPRKELIELCKLKENIILVPNPENVDKIIQKADIYISTTRLGSGLKLRLMDGLRNGLPILTHTISAQGYENFHQYEWFQTFSVTSEFANKLEMIIQQLKSEKIDRNEITFTYNDVFSFEAGVKRVSKFIKMIYE